MKCNWCNSDVQANTKFCPNCGKEIVYNNQQTMNQQQMQQQMYNQGYPVEQKANVGLAILSWFIPLVGLILFITKKNNEPKTAKACGVCALISFILSFIASLLLFAIPFMIGFTSEFEEDYDNENNYTYEENYDYEDDYDYDNNNSANENTNNNVGNNTTNNDNTSTNVDTTANSSTNWKDYKMVINNQTVTLPTTYTQLKSLTGASYKSSDEKTYLGKNNYTYLNMYKNDKFVLTVDIINTTASDLIYTECPIINISQREYHIEQGSTPIVFPGGLVAGQKITEDELIKLFGEPQTQKEYNGENYVSRTYIYQESKTWSTRQYYKIEVVNGVIDTLTLDRKSY